MTYLVTGGTGSMGQRLVWHILEKRNPGKVIIYSRDDHKQKDMERKFHDDRLRFIVGDVRDERRMRSAMQGVDYCIHTAALKHVDKGEYNPDEYDAVNRGGSVVVRDACREAYVDRAVLLSTDKAVEPINLYGCTKASAEKLWLGGCVYEPIYTVVRYGNVTNSAGSVIPYFSRIAKEGGELPVTSPNMTRFAMSFQAAIDLVMYALHGDPQVVYVGKAKAYSMALLIAALDCADRWREVGARPGEKYHECLVSSYEAGRCYDFGDHYEIAPEVPWDDEYEFCAGGVKVPTYVQPGEWWRYSSDMAERLSIDELREML